MTDLQLDGSNVYSKEGKQLALTRKVRNGNLKSTDQKGEEEEEEEAVSRLKCINLKDKQKWQEEEINI